MRKLVSFLLTIAIFSSHTAQSNADLVANWSFTGLTGGGPSPFNATNSDANLTIGGLTRGAGLTGGAAGNAFGGAGYDVAASAAAAVANNDFITFSVTANSGYQVSLSDFATFNLRRSSTGPSTSELQYAVGNSSFTTIGNPISLTSSASSGNTIPTIDLTGINALQNVASGTAVTFRFANYNSTADTGTFYLQNSSGNPFQLNGTTTTVAAVPEPMSFVYGSLIAGVVGIGVWKRRRRSAAPELAV